MRAAKVTTAATFGIFLLGKSEDLTIANASVAPRNTFCTATGTHTEADMVATLAVHLLHARQARVSLLASSTAFTWIRCYLFLSHHSTARHRHRVDNWQTQKLP